MKRKSNLCETESTSKKKAHDETVTKSSEEVSNVSDVSQKVSEIFLKWRKILLKTIVVTVWKQ